MTSIGPPEKPARAQHAKAKRHHYIPELIQRRFADSDLHLWCYDKRHPSYGIERKPIARLFREWNLYTFVGTDGSRDRSSEARLSQIEGRAAPVLERIISEVRQGRLARLVERDREALTALLIAQLKRSPDYFDAAMSVQDTQADVASMVTEFVATGGTLTASERAEVESGRLAGQIRRNILAMTAPQPLLHSSAAVLQRGLTVGIVTAANRSLLLGSSPFARLLGRQTGRNGLMDPTAEAWLPVAPDVALCSVGTRQNEHVFPLDDKGVKILNTVVAYQSTVIASRSRELVAAFSRQYPTMRHRPPPPYRM